MTSFPEAGQRELGMLRMTLFMNMLGVSTGMTLLSGTSAIIGTAKAIKSKITLRFNII